jgi:DNA/RNA-binding domain of Phe-tRNA-synthetase-like protein
MIEVAPDFAAAGILVGLGRVVADVVVAPSDAALDRVSAEAVTAATGRLEVCRAQDWTAVAATRAAYKALGKDPARYRPAAEALLRRVAQGKGLFRVNTVVEVNNLLSLETGFSIGTYDLGKLQPPLVFRPSRPGEAYEGIGRGPLNLEGLPVFADTLGPFGSPTSDSARSMVDSATTRILMVLIGFAPVMVEAVHLVRARGLLEMHCIGSAVGMGSAVGTGRVVDSGLVAAGANGAD